MRTRDAAILIVPGLGGSGPDHWQSRWERRLPTARRVEQDDWDNPDRRAWRDRIAQAIGLASRPVVIIAHSLGVISAADAMNLAAGAGVAGAFLVAPPDPEDSGRRPDAIRDFAPVPRRPLPCPSFLIASRNDPFASFERSQQLAVDWNAFLIDAGDAGHINGATGHGPWPEGLLLFARLMRNLQPRLKA